MKTIFTSILVLGIILCSPNHIHAWGKKGHGIVAEIAYSMLDSNTKKSVHRYLGTTTIEEASTWMDDVRSDHSYDYMKSWHYVNIEKGKQYSETKDGNIINALNNSIAILEHRDKMADDEIKKNLMIIFHLTGDLHMPLHIGYENDKGGNDIHTSFLGTPANLHRVWDTEIIEHEGITMTDCLSLYEKMNKGTISELKEVNIVNWINEPRDLLENVYDFMDGQIDHIYIDKNKPIIEKQLLIAGIRLAAVLNKVFES
jgi:hypothetical protein